MAKAQGDDGGIGLEARPADPSPAPRRRLRATNVVVVVLLLIVLALAALIWSQLARSAVGQGPASQPDNPGTIRQEAESRSRGQDPQGSNSSQDAYTNQNQTREPPSR